MPFGYGLTGNLSSAYFRKQGQGFYAGVFRSSNLKGGYSMKTKKSRRLLAVFLSAVMVLSTFAAMPFSSYAAEHTAEDLKALVDQYESRVESGTIYTNLADSYTAWYDAYLTYVLVTAGVRDAEEVDTAYNTLQTEMNEMTAWSPYQATQTAAADGSYTADILTGGDVMSNVLYAYGVGSDSAYNSVTTGQWYNTQTRTGVQYGDAVLMYDGIHEVGFPISHFQARIMTVGTSQTRSLNPTTSGFELRHDWHGYSTTVGYQTNTFSTFSYIQNPGSGGSESSGSENNPYRYSNTLYWNGDSNSFGSNYSIQYSSQDWITYDQSNRSGTFTQSANIYVINYAGLISAVNNYLSNICDYAYSQVLDYLTAVDTATSLDPQSYITGSNISSEVATLSNQLSIAVSNLNSKRSSVRTAVNMQSYIDLARNYAAYTLVAAGNNDDGYYTDGTYTIFSRAYNNVTSTFNSLSSKSIRFTDATSLNTTLVNAYTGLVIAEQYIDDSALQALFTQYYNLTSSYYTAETYSALTDKINAALVYYNNGSYAAGTTLKDNEEDRAIYNTILTDVQNAMAGLRISHDAQVAISGYNFSYNMAIEYANSLDGGQYSNYNEVMNAIAAATALMTALDTTAFTDQTSMIAEYTEVLSDIAVALGSLEYSFTVIPDGTIVSQTVGSTSGYSADNVRSYLSNAITNITYFKTVSGTSSYTTEYDLTFDNSWYEWGAYRGALYHGLGFGALGQDTVTYDNGTMSVLWKEGGAALEGSDGSYTYHSALMKTSSAGESNYVHVRGNSSGQKIYGETTVNVGDLGIRAVDFVTPDIYELFYVYTGTTGTTRNRINTDVKQTVTIIDISDLIEKVSEASNIVAACQNNNFGCYTTDSWNTFSNALSAAQADMAYTDMTNDQIVSEAQTRYNNLQNAITGLQLNTAEGSHNMIEQADSTHATCEADGTAHYICSVCGYEVRTPETALGHDITYTSNNDGATHATVCSRGDINNPSDPCVDEDGNLYCDLCGQALYDPANWTAFNAAKAELEDALAAAANGTVKYTSAALGATNTAIEAISYYNYDSAMQATVPLEQQDSIDTQTAAITAALEALNNGLADESVYEAFEQKLGTLNADAYDITSVKSAVADVEYTSQVTVNGTEYTGYDYDNYNIALGTALSENAYPYTVTVYDFNNVAYYLVDNGDGTFSYTQDQAQATTFTYGDYVTAPNPNTDNPQEEVEWSFKSQPISKTDGAYESMPAHYETTATEYSFNVLGNTEVFTSANAENSANSCKVTFVEYLDGVKSGNVIYTMYVEAGTSVRYATLPIPSNIPFYERTTVTFADGSTFSARGQVINEDSIVNVYYESWGIDSYEVTLIGTEGETVSTQHYEFNELVTLSDEGAVAYINNDNGKVLCYGSEYSFYACQDITVKAVTEIEEEASVDVIATPISDGAKVYLVGSFALPEDATIKAFGFVLDGFNSNHTGLSLADVNPSMYVVNLFAYDYYCPEQNGNQFMINFTSGSAPSTYGTYVAYAIYEDADGNECYAYSDVITNAPLR